MLTKESILRWLDRSHGTWYLGNRQGDATSAVPVKPKRGADKVNAYNDQATNVEEGVYQVSSEPIPHLDDAQDSLEILSVDELRKKVRATLGSNAWVSMARKEQLINSLITGTLPSYKDAGAAYAPSPSPTPTPAQAPSAPADLANALALAVAKYLPAGGSNPNIEKLENDIAFIQRSMPKFAATISEIKQAQEARAKDNGQIVELVESKFAGVVAECLQKVNAEFAAKASILKASVEATTDERLEAKLDSLGDALTVKLQKKLVKALEVKVPGQPKVALGVQHKQLPDLLQILVCGEHAYLAGPAGSGKTRAAEECAKAMGFEFYPQSVGSQTSLSQLFGYMDANGNYVSTVFRKAFEHGGVYLLDEVDNGNANVLTAFNAALGNQYCSFPDKVVKAHPNFICVAAANTWGNGGDRQYVGRNALDGAFLNRFTQLDWAYDEDLERAICGNHDWALRVQAIRKAVFIEKARVLVTPRASIKGAKLLSVGFKRQKVEELLIWGGVDLATKKKILAQVPAEPVTVRIEEVEVL